MHGIVTDDVRRKKSESSHLRPGTASSGEYAQRRPEGDERANSIHREYHTAHITRIIFIVITSNINLPAQPVSGFCNPNGFRGFTVELGNRGDVRLHGISANGGRRMQFSCCRCSRLVSDIYIQLCSHSSEIRPRVTTCHGLISPTL